MMCEYSICSSDNKWRAEISALHGANVTRLQYEGQDVLVPLKSDKELKVNPYIQGAPLLFPANRTHEGKFVFEDTEYFLPLNEPHNNAHLHGLLHLQKFKLKELTKDTIVLCYENFKKIYPFKFQITVTYSLADNTFSQAYVIENTDSKNMPLTFALHTSFVEPDLFSVSIDSCQEKDAHHIPTGRYIPLNNQEKLYPVGSKSQGIEISGYYKACGHTAKIGDFTYTVSDNFDHWILFNGKGEKKLLCVEPQCGAVNGLNLKDGCKILMPNEKIIFSTCIQTSPSK